MMDNIVKIVAVSVLLLAGCGDDVYTEQQPDANKMHVAITRSSESGFSNGDRVGLFVAYSGEVHYNNVDLRYDYSRVTWCSSVNIYWKDAATPADLYCYYPYNKGLGSLYNSLKWSVANQSSIDSYRSSDVLLGCAKGVSPTNETVGVQVTHAMSHLVVKLKAGNGLNQEDIAGAGVEICNVNTEASINVGEQKVSATEEVGVIKPLFSDGHYCAHVVPCRVDNKELVRITIGDNEYSLNQTIVFEPGKEYICTITLSMSDQGVNIGITDWITQTKDYGGVVW